VGDRIIEIGGRKIRRFRDLMEAVSLGNVKDGIPFVVERSGQSAPITILVTPDSSGLVPRIGVHNPWSTTLSERDSAAMPGSAAAEAEPPLQPGDRIVKIDDTPIHEFGQIQSCLAQHPDKTLQVTVERQPARSSRAETAAKPEEVNLQLPPQPVRRLGLEMTMGEICAIQKDSPAAVVGLQTGDLIQAIDHQPVGDPLTLPDRLRARAGKMIVLTVDPKGEKEAHDVRVRLRHSDSFALAMDDGSPVAVPQLGIAYRVLNRVQAVRPDSPAAQAGLQAGDEITKARILPPDAETQRRLKSHQAEIPLDFDAEHRNWPMLHYVLQRFAPGTTVELQWIRQGATQKAKLTPEVDKGSFSLERGLLFEPIYFYQAAKSWSAAVADGAEETCNATLLVYRTLRMLGTQVSFKALGGPVMIFRAAKGAASEGIANLLIFLTVLSANLAVLNFLPIPLLDGGLMVLMLYEAVRGKPANERVQVALTYVGLAFIIVLMLWVCGLDFGLIPRR
jgi:regulator of sigma E protease